MSDEVKGLEDRVTELKGEIKSKESIVANNIQALDSQQTKFKQLKIEVVDMEQKKCSLVENIQGLEHQSENESARLQDLTAQCERHVSQMNDLSKDIAGLEDKKQKAEAGLTEINEKNEELQRKFNTLNSEIEDF